MKIYISKPETECFNKSLSCRLSDYLLKTRLKLLKAKETTKKETWFDWTKSWFYRKIIEISKYFPNETFKISFASIPEFIPVMKEIESKIKKI